MLCFIVYQWGDHLREKLKHWRKLQFWGLQLPQDSAAFCMERLQEGARPARVPVAGQLMCPSVLWAVWGTLWKALACMHTILSMQVGEINLKGLDFFSVHREP